MSDADEQIATLRAEKKSFRDGLLESGVVILRQKKEIDALTEKVSVLTERCKELEKWAGEHGLIILDKKEFWGGNA